jgi:ubiquinone/menaquinone biosynthesis C-methylase UbiE
MSSEPKDDAADKEETEITSANPVAKWWADNPMTYADDHGLVSYEGMQVEFGSKEFFRQVDTTFHKWNGPLHRELPFGKIFDYEKYRGKRVLEIGCGMGTMSSQWASVGAIVTAVDLNPTAVAMTTRRFEAFGLAGEILQVDGKSLPFPDNSFDYVYSWGVLHHSPDLDSSVAEMFRVAAPNAGYGVMLYHRHSFLHWYMTEFIEGLLHMERKFLNSLELASRYGDGHREEGNPHTWPVTRAEARLIFGKHSQEVNVDTLGTELDGLFKMLLPGLGMRLPIWAKKPWARRFGWSLWIHGFKASE